MAHWRYHRWSYCRHCLGPSEHVLRHGKSLQFTWFLATVVTSALDRNLAGSIRSLFSLCRHDDILRASSLIKSPNFILNLPLQLFATAKDVSIGPVAVMSLQVAEIISYIDKKHPKEWSNPQIAINIAFVCGFAVLGIGLLRLGWLVELIPLVAVAGFMTGSAINIAVGQIPGLMGITGFKSVSSYLSFKP